MLEHHIVRYYDPPAWDVHAPGDTWSRPMQGVDAPDEWLAAMIQDFPQMLLGGGDEPSVVPPVSSGTVAGLYACGGYWVFVRMADVGEGWLEPARVDVRAYPYRYGRGHAGPNERPVIKSDVPWREIPVVGIFADLRKHYAELLAARVEAAPRELSRYEGEEFLEDLDAVKAHVEAIDAQERGKEAARRLQGQPVGRPRLTDHFLKGVADAYVAADRGEGPHPGKPRYAVRAYAIATSDKFSDKVVPAWSSVDRWIEMATTRKFLDPAPTKGKARGKPKGDN